MKTDNYWMSLMWGRVGAAVLVLAGVVLGAFGIDFSADAQSEAYGMVAGIIAGLGGLVAIVSKLREQARLKKATGMNVAASAQSGKANLKTILFLFTIGACTIFMFSGCAGLQNATATQQLMEQTSDPMTISLGVYHDGLKLYVEAQETYKPYQEFIKETNPEIDAEVIGYFRKARKILKDWKNSGVLPGEEEKTFREALRDVSLTMARYMQTKT